MRRIIAIFVLILAGGVAGGQELAGERPRLYSGPPLTAKERACRESLYQFAYGVLCSHEDRLLEALKAFEEATKLDPEAAGAYRAQAPILVMLDRPRDALTQLKRVLELDPHDHDTWFLAARLHKSLGEGNEYRTCLEKGLAVPGLVQDDPALAQQLYHDLGHYFESTDAFAQAIAAYSAGVKILDHPDLVIDHGPLIEKNAIVARAAETYERIGNLHRKLKQYPAAIAAYRNAIARQPQDSGRLSFHLAKVTIDQNKLADAIGYLDAYLRLQPAGTEAYQMKIDALNKLGRTAEVVPWLEQASRADALNVNLKMLLAQQYAATGAVDRAEQVYEALANDSPSEDIYRAYFKLYREHVKDAGQRMLQRFDVAVTAGTKKQGDGATAQARAMLTVFRDDVELGRTMVDAAFNTRSRPQIGGETRFYLAAIAEKHGRLKQAEYFYRQAITEGDPRNLGTVYVGLIGTLWRQRKYEDIAVECRKALDSVPNLGTYYFKSNLANALSHLGKQREALSVLEEALQVAADSERSKAIRLKVHILTRDRKFVEAEAVAKKLLDESLAPGDVQEARYVLSGVYSAWKKMDKSEEILMKILETEPANATANNDLGYIWADQSKNLPQAEAMIRKAIELDRDQRKLGEDADNAAYIDSLGWILFRRGQHEAARRELERAVSLPDGDDPTLWDHLGDVYFRLERYAQARSTWERSVELYERDHVRPQDERFRDVQRKLKKVRELVRAQ
jgi:tetratricopeptide (TPR) repeat protein